MTDSQVTATGDVTLCAPTVALGDLFEVMSGGELAVDNDPEC